MKLSLPHYLLFSEADDADGLGRWRFVLRSVDGVDRFEAADVEPGVQGERLDLLTVVRALESLDEPSRVTMVGCSRYVRHGMQYGLGEWRSNGWRWEAFGQLVPVKNGDLWQRIDRAMRFHRVECSRRRFDPPHEQLAGPRRRLPVKEDGADGLGGGNRNVGQEALRYQASPEPPRRQSGAMALLRRWRQRVVRSWKAAKPELLPG